MDTGREDGVKDGKISSIEFNAEILDTVAVGGEDILGSGDCDTSQIILCGTCLLFCLWQQDCARACDLNVWMG